MKFVALILTAIFSMSAYSAPTQTPAASAAPAESSAPQVVPIGGMHCQGCVKTLTKKICTENRFASCEVKLTDEKAQKGELKVTAKAGETLDLNKIKEQIKDAGYTTN